MLVPGVVSILGKPLEAVGIGSARGDVQRVVRTATVVNILSSVAECGGFLDSTADLGGEAMGRGSLFACARMERQA